MHSKAGFEGDLWRRKTPAVPGRAGGVWKVGGRVRNSIVVGARVEDDHHVKTQGRDAWADLS